MQPGRNDKFSGDNPLSMIPYFPAPQALGGGSKGTFELLTLSRDLTERGGNCLMSRMIENAQETGGGDAAAVERTLAGDPEAFRVLVERHSRGLFRVAFRMMGNAHDAEEIVQEAFLRAYQKLGRFESRANFGTWLHRIAVNAALDQLRRRKIEDTRRATPSPAEEVDAPSPADLVPDGRPAPDRIALSSELQRKMRAAMSELSPAERTAFVMRHWEGCGIEEIAQALDLRQGAAKNTVFRAIQKLRQALEPFVAPRGAAGSHNLAKTFGAGPGSEG